MCFRNSIVQPTMKISIMMALKNSLIRFTNAMCLKIFANTCLYRFCDHLSYRVSYKCKVNQSSLNILSGIFNENHSMKKGNTLELLSTAPVGLFTAPITSHSIRGKTSHNYELIHISLNSIHFHCNIRIHS